MAVKTIEAYLENLDDNGKKYVNDFIEFMNTEFFKLNARISFSMPMWLVGTKMNEGYVAISAAKKHYSIHFSNEEFVSELGEQLVSCKTGKRCINIKYGDDEANQIVKNAVKEFLN